MSSNGDARLGSNRYRPHASPWSPYSLQLMRVCHVHKSHTIVNTTRRTAHMKQLCTDCNCSLGTLCFSSSCQYHFPLN
eukprot:1485876-Amphidinium_carterae.1